MDIRSTWLLNRRWNAKPFVKLYGRRLRQAAGVYTRSVQISATLAAAGISHQLEIHEAQRELIGKGYLADIVKRHRQGIIEWLFPISQAAADVLVRSGATAERVLVSPSGAKLSAFDRIAPLRSGSAFRRRRERWRRG